VVYEPGYHKSRRCSTSKVRSGKFLWLVLFGPAVLNNLLG